MGKATPQEFFHFKQFSILQSGVTWKVGFDGVLLGAWAAVGSAHTILDIGTGTGLLALMAAQLNGEAQITGLEIDEATARVAEYNFKSSRWRDRLTALNGDIMGDHGLPYQNYDVILSNPPYFPSGAMVRHSPRRLARTGDGYNAFSLPELYTRFVEADGKVNAIIPYGICDAVIQGFKAVGIVLRRRCDVRHSASSRFSRSLVEFGQQCKECVYETLTLFDGSDPTDDYKVLLKPFRDPRKFTG